MRKEEGGSNTRGLRCGQDRLAKDAGRENRSPGARPQAKKSGRENGRNSPARAVGRLRAGEKEEWSAGASVPTNPSDSPAPGLPGRGEPRRLARPAANRRKIPQCPQGPALGECP